MYNSLPMANSTYFQGNPAASEGPNGFVAYLMESPNLQSTANTFSLTIWMDQSHFGIGDNHNN